MWQAHSWRSTAGWVRDRTPNFTYHGLSTLAVRTLLSLLVVIPGSLQADESSLGDRSGVDTIFSGLSIQSRIIGGGNAEVGAWPSMAAIATTGIFPFEDRFFCGGTVISDRWILTAAHCMYDPFGAESQPSDLSVVVGINDLQDESETEVVVTNIYIHPQFDSESGTLKNDIALLELANVVPAPAMTLFAGNPETLKDRLAFIAGWGATGVDVFSGAETYPNLLQDAAVPIVSLAACNAPESYQGGVIDSQVCAGFREGGIDSCVGDSGGPLYVLENGEQIQVGITSFGNGCGLPDFYGVYTNISAFRDWISNYVDIRDSSDMNNILSGSGLVSAASTDKDVVTVGNFTSNGILANAGGATDGGVSVGASSGGGSLSYGFLSLLLGVAYLRPRFGVSKSVISLVLFIAMLSTATSVYAQEDLVIQSRIVGGSVASVGQWPSLVAITSVGTEPLRLRQFCGGSVVADRWVLTAAHCLFNVDGSLTTADQIRVVAGINDLNDPDALETVVTNIFMHPLYENTVIPANDIALLELGTSVLAPLNLLLDSDPDLLVGQLAYIAGWGALTEEGPFTDERFPSLLQDAAIPIVSRAQCNLPESYNGSIQQTQLCAGYRRGGVDTCQGDSGGPIYVLEGTRQVQIGITSFGAGCARPDLYGVYTNVESYKTWMNTYFMSSVTAVKSASSVNVGVGKVAGSLHPLFLSFLAGFAVFSLLRTAAGSSSRWFNNSSRWFNISDDSNNVARRRSSQFTLVFAALVSASACSSNQPISEAIDASTSTQTEIKAIVMDSEKKGSADTVELRLSETDGVVGIHPLLLGSTRLETIQALTDARFSASDCRVDKTAIQGTGRLFVREQCHAQPLDTTSVQGLMIDTLTYQILDNRLVKLDVRLRSGDKMALTRQLDALYEFIPSADGSSEWRSGGNHIRLVVLTHSDATKNRSALSLQMIDGRLSDKLPALFDYP